MQGGGGVLEIMVVPEHSVRLDWEMKQVPATSRKTPYKGRGLKLAYRIIHPGQHFAGHFFFCTFREWEQTQLQNSQPWNKRTRKNNDLLKTDQRWNSWAAALVEVSGNKLESSQTRVFVWFLPSLFCSTNCYSWKALSFLVLRIFLYAVLKPYGSRVWFTFVTRSRPTNRE